MNIATAIKRALNASNSGRRLHHACARLYYSSSIPRWRLHRSGSKILGIVKLAADSQRIVCWADFGTLLGVVRDGALIQHDTDLDFALAPISTPDLRQFVRELLRNGCVFARAVSVAGEIAEISLRYNNVPLDFFVYRVECGARVFFTIENDLTFGDGHRVVARGKKTPAPTAFDVRLIGGSPVTTPVNADQILEALYGSSWRTPDPTWKHIESARVEKPVALDGVALNLHEFLSFGGSN